MSVSSKAIAPVFNFLSEYGENLSAQADGDVNLNTYNINKRTVLANY